MGSCLSLVCCWRSRNQYIVEHSAGARSVLWHMPLTNAAHSALPITWGLHTSCDCTVHQPSHMREGCACVPEERGRGRRLKAHAPGHGGPETSGPWACQHLWHGADVPITPQSLWQRPSRSAHQGPTRARAEHVATAMQILGSAALLGGGAFLPAHGAAAAHMLGACIGALNERGTLLVTAAPSFCELLVCCLLAT
jgi:hypothetical protein